MSVCVTRETVFKEKVTREAALGLELPGHEKKKKIMKLRIF